MIRLLVLGWTGFRCVLREGVLAAGRRVVQFDRAVVERLGDLPAGALELPVLVGTAIAGVSGRTLGFILISVILILFFLLR